MADIVAKPLENIYVQGDGPVRKSELRSILKKIHVEVPEGRTNATLEVFEVLEVKSDADLLQQEVIGRYVYSQHGDVEVNSYKPANSNIIQYPMVGELWLGFDYKGQSYYLARLSDDNISVNPQSVGESDKVIAPGVKKEPRGLLKLFGKFKRDVNPISKAFEEGSTLIQGRFNNHISLGSDERSEGQITINNNDEMNIELGYKPRLMFTPRVNSFFSRPQEEDFLPPTITLSSGRVEINSTDEYEGIAMTSKGNILIDSDDGDILLDSKRVIRLRPRSSTIDMDVKNGGTILTTTKDGIPFPQLEMMGFLKMMFGISDFFKGMLLGVPKLVNPFTIPLGVKEIMKGLKGAEAFIQAIVGLEFLSLTRLETKTIEEIKAVLPIPAGFSGIIDDVSNITDEQIKKLEELEKTASEQLQKASQLQSAISTVPPSAAAVSGLLADGSFDSFDGVEDLKSVLGDNPSDEELGRYISNGGLSGFENQVSGISGNIGMADQARSYQNIFKARS